MPYIHTFCTYIYIHVCVDIYMYMCVHIRRGDAGGFRWGSGMRLVQESRSACKEARRGPLRAFVRFLRLCLPTGSMAYYSLVYYGPYNII